MSRLFVAVWPPDEVAEELRALRRKDQRGIRFVPPENWHITLRFLGSADPDAVAGALDAADLPGASAHLDAGVDLLFDRILAIPVDGLTELTGAVESATAGLGTEGPRRRFTGHLTIARCRKGAMMPPALGTLVRGSFPVTEIALVESRLRPTGAQYQTVASWPTVGNPG
ncbi:MAG: RNA 2',3'-cyclic phosphodiesterase [Desertimonas sp.]